jgi:hypothetical protein
MTAEELKRKVGFRTEEDEHSVVVIGEVTFKEVFRINKEELNAYYRGMDALTEVKEKIREHIARAVYSDQRRWLGELISKLETCGPFNYPEREQLISELMAAARYQETDDGFAA